MEANTPPYKWDDLLEISRNQAHDSVSDEPFDVAELWDIGYANGIFPMPRPDDWDSRQLPPEISLFLIEAESYANT
jgi:hypothetical protein